MTRKHRAKWSPAKERVVRAAMRWYLWFQSPGAESRHALRLVKAFDKACAALSKARASRGRKAT